jgi:putative glycosyltransferase (TIGR04372 family)
MGFKYLRVLKFLINLIWSIPLLLSVYVLKPYKKIKLVKIYSEAFGHFLFEGTEVFQNYLRKPKKEFYIVYFSNSKRISNQFWAKIITRNLPVYNNIGWNLGKLFSIILPSSSHFQESPSIKYQASSTHFFGKSENSNLIPFKFLASENNQGLNWLKNHGWQSGDRFVCLIVRDQAYDNSKGRKNKISQVSYRNSPLHDFVPAINWLTSKNVWVIRMGSVMQSKLETNNLKYIDYSFCDSKSDLLDIWLLSKCNGIISTGTGPDALGVINKIPILQVGLSPLYGLWSFANTLTVPKNLYSIALQKNLNLSETLDLTWNPSGFPKYCKYATDLNYKELGIKVVNLTSMEIFKATREFWLRIEKKWIESENDIALQSNFWRIFLEHPYYSINHNWKNPDALIGADWLRQQGFEFLK